MHIDVAEWRQVEHPLRNDSAIRHDDDRVRTDLLQLRLEFRVVLDLLRLCHRDSVLERDLLNRSRSKLQTAALGTVRLRNHQLHVVALANESLQAGDGKHRSSAEDQSHGCNGKGTVAANEIFRELFW